MENENVKIELIFEDGSEEIELTKEIFLVIQQIALKDDMSFEDKFLQLLREEVEKKEKEK